MNPMRTFFLMACLVAASFASSGINQNRMGQGMRNGNNQNGGNNMKPTEWLSPAELENLPSLDEITYDKLQRMSPEQGAKLLNKVYHLSQINHDLTPTFVPSASNIPCYILQPNNKNISVNLNQLAEAAETKNGFGNEELTIIITGAPQDLPEVRKANRQLVQNIMERYDAELESQENKQQRLKKNKDYDNKYSKENNNDDSDEDYSDNNERKEGQTGNVVLIDLGEAVNTFKRNAMLDVEKTGKMIGKQIAKVCDKADVPQETIHIIGQLIGAHVAGEASNELKRLTGHKARRITGLSPSKVYAKNENTLTSLTRGDADFVDVIHSSAYGMGVAHSLGDVDFFPNGPCVATPGSDNIIEAAMRATRYFAESCRPGNERNFPAVPASNMKQYKTKSGHGKRAYMGIDTEFDVQGDYILQVNAKSPFGKSEPAEKQAYHNPQNQQQWKNIDNDEN